MCLFHVFFTKIEGLSFEGKNIMSSRHNQFIKILKSFLLIQARLEILYRPQEHIWIQNYNNIDYKFNPY